MPIFFPSTDYILNDKEILKRWIPGGVKYIIVEYYIVNRLECKYGIEKEMPIII